MTLCLADEREALEAVGSFRAMAFASLAESRLVP
jgi:hypothetical protein